MWSTVTGFNGHEFVQIVVGATIVLVFDDNHVRQVSGQVMLQRFDEDARFRIAYEGNGKRGTPMSDSVELPTDVPWAITTKLERSTVVVAATSWFSLTILPIVREAEDPILSSFSCQLLPATLANPRCFMRPLSSLISVCAWIFKVAKSNKLQPCYHSCLSFIQ
jgi:hypothetical protein